MAIQLFIGYIGEGTTDQKFIPEIINRTFAQLAMECRTDVEIDDARILTIPKSSFVEMMVEAAQSAVDKGCVLLCIHADADKKSTEVVYKHKIEPLIKALETCSDQTHCKNIVPIIPITETEAWMLADKTLLKARINAQNLSDQELGIEKSPETYADPKSTITNALRIAQSGKTKRRRGELTIDSLYSELGQAIDMQKLKQLPSFKNFEQSARSVLIQLGYIKEKK